MLAALIGKAATATIPVRTNRSRDTEDAALLLSLLDPSMDPGELTRSERAHLCRLQQLTEVEHPAWRILTPDRTGPGSGGQRCGSSCARWPRFGCARSGPACGAT